MYQTATLRALAPHDLEHLARAHDAVAQGLRDAADRRAQELGREDDARRRIAELGELPHRAERLGRHADVPPCAAARQIGAETGVPPETVAFHMAKRAKELQALARGKRDRKVMRLARRGWSNAEIGSRVGLHPSTISRIVQNGLRYA